MASRSTSKPTKKRKRVVLTISEKIEVIKLLDKSVSYAVISEKYGIGQSTVGDIKKSREKLLKFKKETESMGMKHEAKTMKLGTNEKLDKALHLWFCQKRMEGVPVSGPLLCEKALLLSQQLQPDKSFVASEGWKWRFCKRYGIRSLSMEGEKLDADRPAADEFVSSFSQFVHDEKLSLDQDVSETPSPVLYKKPRRNGDEPSSLSSSLTFSDSSVDPPSLDNSKDSGIAEDSTDGPKPKSSLASAPTSSNGLEEGLSTDKTPQSNKIVLKLISPSGKS